MNKQLELRKLQEVNNSMNTLRLAREDEARRYAERISYNNGQIDLLNALIEEEKTEKAKAEKEAKKEDDASQ